MKILHITPDIYEGGVASLVYEMGKYQVSESNNVTILCTVSSHKQMSRKAYFNDAGIKLIYSPYTSVYDFRVIFTIRKILPDFDLIHVHLFPNQFFVRLAVSLIPKFKRPPIITTEHNTFNNRRKYPLFRFFDRWLYNGYSNVICISNQTKVNLRKWLKRKFLSSNKIMTITNGVDLNKFSVPAKPHKENGIIIMVSRLEYPKDPLTLVRAISRCESNVNVYFVGSGPLDKDIIECAKSLNIKNRIHLLGNRTDIPDLLSKASIGVLSTNWDGFGLVAVEYMAASLPVLASDVDGLRDVIGDKESLFPVGDDKMLSIMIDRLLNDSALYQFKSQYFKTRSSLFSIEKMNKEYLELYQRICISI